MTDLEMVLRRREGLPERQIDVRGARGVSPSHIGSRQAQREPLREVGMFGGHAGIDEPLHVPTEQLPLIDGLVRAHAVKLGRAVRREEHE